MAYVPKNAKWYWAEVIEEITVGGDSRNTVHRNIILIEANSPEEAYERAVDIGKRCASSYENPEGAIVQIRFRGLGGLDVIHDKLAHGAELLYQEDIGVPEEQIRKWICPKVRLPLFRDIKEPDKRPNYGSKEIVEEVRNLLEKKI